MKTLFLIVILALPCVAKKNKDGAAADIRGAAGSVAGGAAKGAGDLAGGAIKGAFQVVTLHPLSAALTMAGSAQSAHKDVRSGAVKGAAKAAKGAGKIVRKAL